MTIHFQYEKSTKGAHRYQEVDQAGQVLKGDKAKVGTLYIRRTAIPDHHDVAPAALTVTIQAHGGGAS